VANVVVSALATWNGKALKKAKQDVDVFNKQLKTLARTFGVTFSAAAIVSFSKKAIKAFTEDEAAAKRLALQLENTGNAFRVSEVEGYIKSLEKTNAILSDLRGPFQTLLNLTGSVELAQRSLEAALNISAGTGESLSTVISAIASGIRGQTKAIKNLNTGIDSNIIATGDMNQIMEALEKRFSGQSAARLDTYAGKMDVLRKGADEATKSIGTGLVNALTILSKDNSVESLATNFENLGNNIAFAIEEMAKLIKKFDDLVNNPTFAAGLVALAALSKNPKILATAIGTVGLNAASNVALGGGRTSSSTALNNANARENRLQLAQIKTGTTYRRLENEQLKKKTEVDKLSEKFDLERIGLMKALGEATDAETKLRIQAKIAILDNNEALAKKYLAELNAKTAADLLADSANNAASALNTLPNKYDQIFTSLVGQFKSMGIEAGAAAGLAASSARLQAQADAFFAQAGQYAVPGGMPSSASTAAAAATPTIVPQVTVNTGAVLTNNQELERYIIDAVGNATKLGDRLVPRGAVPTFLLQ
jgi:hypothetical protein